MGSPCLTMVSMVSAKIFLGVLILSTMAMANMDSMKGKHMVVTTILRGEPFLSLKPDHASLSGKDRYEGFLLDLVTALADKLGFDFSLEMIGDGRYGQYDSNTRAREEVVDFSMPFMHVG